LLDAPVSREKDPRAHVYIIDHVKPGAEFSRRMQVINDTPNSHHILLYPDAAKITGGGFVIEPGRTVNDLVTWIKVAPTTLDLAPRASATINVTISVPSDASSGERYAAVLAEMPPPPGGQGLLVSSRVGIRVYLDVGPGGEPASNFTVDSLTAERAADGSPVIQAAGHNTGGRALDMRGQLRLDQGPGGLSAGPFDARLGTTLAPGQTEPVTVTLDKALPAGPWHARIDLQSGLLKRAAEGTITFPAAAGTSAAPVKAKSIPLGKNRNVLVPVATGLLLALAIGIFLLVWKRRRRKEDDEVEPLAAAAQ
jgi:hypothetical protein